MTQRLLLLSNWFQNSVLVDDDGWTEIGQQIQTLSCPNSFTNAIANDVANPSANPIANAVANNSAHAVTHDIPSL